MRINFHIQKVTMTNDMVNQGIRHRSCARCLGKNLP